MKIYALTGKSGTGKSYQAMSLCRHKNIESLIDDGLFIYRNRVEGGISAKRQKNRVSAIKTALFVEDDHMKSVKKRIGKLKPKNILIVATSDKMAEKIVKRLGLPEIEEIIHIEDITTEKERKIARKQRLNQGKHVIPVPTLQLKRAFAGYFMDPLKILKGSMLGGDKQPKGNKGTERTVVRPTFSYLGEFYISDSVIKDIACCLAEESENVDRVIKVYENTSPDSLVVDVKVVLKKGNPLWESAENYQKSLADRIESMTAFNVNRIDIDVRGVE